MGRGVWLGVTSEAQTLPSCLCPRHPCPQAGSFKAMRMLPKVLTLFLHLWGSPQAHFLTYLLRTTLVLIASLLSYLASHTFPNTLDFVAVCLISVLPLGATSKIFHLSFSCCFLTANPHLSGPASGQPPWLPNEQLRVCVIPLF